MRDDKRACFALIAATLVNKRRYNSVYDYSASKYVNVSSSNIQSSYLSFFDYNRGGYISGDFQNLYDFPTSSFVSLQQHGNKLSGYDYETGSNIDFTVHGNDVTVYDYQTYNHYNYSVWFAMF